MSSSRRDEPLRDLALAHALRTAGPHPVRLRSGLVDRLTVAQTLLPRAFRFLVIAGHRAPAPCPHVAGHATGGAADLTLHVTGEPEPALWSATPPPLWPTAEHALRSMGMVGGDRWWHWSFGDDRWSAGTGAPAPLYDVIP
ncbi:hypothetical protein [Amycolatopsis solani]|uniref:hypothetical protein n=1 Tax=Amycolatopsis solani TaxID=3028615 RepID=UPI0025B00089|nr:hypothetical protein [Amycolatopsis sp. MEP2-6]